MKKAFTLVEVLVAIAAGLLLCGTLTAIFVSGWQIFHRETISSDTQSQTKIITASLTRDIQTADKVVASREFNGNVPYTSSFNCLILEMPSLNSSQNPIPNTYDYKVFYKDQTKLMSITEAKIGTSRKSGTRLINNALDSLSFTYFPTGEIVENTDRITISVTISETAYGLPRQTTLTASATLRNK